MEPKNHLNVLNIGNSFSDSLKAYLPDVVSSVPGCSLHLEAASHGGCELHRHWEYICNEENDNVYKMYQDRQFKLREILARTPWDIVSIQQASPLSWKPETYQPYASNIVNYVKKFAPTAEVVIQQTWAYRTDSPFLRTSSYWGINQNEMYERLTDAYNRLASELSLRIIPTGFAVHLARLKQARPFKAYPESIISTLQWPDLPSQGGSLVGSARWLKDPRNGEMAIARDCIHLNARGEFLQACVWFAALYAHNTSEITLRPDSIGDSDVVFLKDIAQEAVNTYTYK